MVRSAQTVQLSCVETKHYPQTEWNELSLDLRHLEVPSGVPKAISKPMVRSAQTVHLSYVEINTFSKWTEMLFHLNNIT
jgi:hypothetical protein